MTSFTTNKNLETPANGEYVDQWEVPLNGDMEIIDAALGGVTNLNATSGNATLSSNIAVTSNYINLTLNITGAMSANVTYTIPSGIGGNWIVRNATTDASGGPWFVTIASGGGGSNVTVIRGKSTMIWSDGTNIRNVEENVSSIGTVTSVDVSGGTTGLTTSGGPVTTNGTITIAGVLDVANGGTNLTAFGTGVSGALAANATGSGGMVLDTNATITTATLVSPTLGTPASGNLVNTTGLPIANTTGTLSVDRGGTGTTTLTANNLIVGNGTSAVSELAPGTSGNVVTSNGTHWVSQATATLSGMLIRAPQVLTSGTQYTTPATCTRIYVEAVGGGGGGGRSSNSTTDGGGGGGGSGAYCAKYFTVVGNTAYTYAIGPGGAGTNGTNGNSQGTAGGNTTFSNGTITITAGGGTGGNSTSAVTGGNAGAGGTAVNGDINVQGNPGMRGYSAVDSSSSGRAGNGGSSFFGGGGRGALSTDNTTINGVMGGGGGGNTSSAGGTGGNGVIRIWEFT